MSLSALIAATAKSLAFVAPTSIGERELAKYGKPPRYVWVPRSESFGAPAIVGGNPRNLHDRTVRADIHAWAVDVASAERLMQALVTALRQAARGANYALSGAEWQEPQWLQLGIVCTVSLDLQIPLPLVRLPERWGEFAEPHTDRTVSLENIENESK